MGHMGYDNFGVSSEKGKKRAILRRKLKGPRPDGALQNNPMADRKLGSEDAGAKRAKATKK